MSGAMAFLTPGGRVRVKICGITNREDALAAVELGADALGFNLFPGSKRFVEIEREAAWIAELPENVLRVAVLVNAPLDDALRVATMPAIHAVQFHGDEDAEYCARFAEAGHPFIRALRLAGACTIDGAHRYSTPHILLDANAGAAYGGTGALIDLALAAEFASRQPGLRLILAGGLNPSNVREAVERVRPMAVDVASGVESEPRRKSSERIGAFVRSAREGKYQ
jgi:phosphoribosylanthranilate isomerase